MEKILIKGGKKLRGEVSISSAKNAILPIIAASILCGDKCVIKNAPMLKDVFVISDVLRDINADIQINSKENIIKIDTSRLIDKEPDSELVRKMRASFLIMGPMIARFGKFRLSLPGGCNIGTRPIDLHLKGFAALGATVNFGHGYVEAHADKLVGNKIYLDFPSVGATENIMMAAVLAKGETIIGNPAGEPEIQDLANFLNSMGAKIVGAGTDMIRIHGVKELNGSIYTPIPDRIEAGTFMAAAAITRSNVKINHINTKHLGPIISKLNEIGVIIEKHEDSIEVNGDRNLKPIDIKTMPYPGFPTDMQAQMMSLLCTINGTSVITETIFENRFMHVGELKRMGGNIKIDGRCAVIEGVKKLTGCEVRASDLRAGAALILGGLAAEGYTKIGDVYHIDRGYVDIEQKFLNLGADIKRIDE
ncbi:UDP-N-acetylglucosamine 1-carboxyvinyltransferase [Clostridium botulinum]|uniref:UDP-N-acetylglucosamine 1-carboxyvinyltransferase n=1 Tax=Clostridium botulinum TaxID=1491 RepID=A0A9Q1UVU5_CLOBO|nr:UDP-N-acetylglucosamine 1-carboxyvinyltransferase [Clostridium botulinum]AEB76925.1 UDP-N-acetylglucosamine 1-carboxyvinyltransferase [Clostridium botulinum BKT015925]KEH98359.1 UDP-N-acetylglucosamine 1-carboxyvinyltransferase [Clostridium botulinum D str. 16868]KEI05100.1 UDP-N-acetylglucosamine 1-carboxyvinyltransferase [Clostridium botulinum C/D str. Sp77]KLU75374.1 UDP-N-acetylglucosamine 1-carboxyvinyltransferase [Clostridium botulinum V891]KOA76230.1 UDP-N-acetylglucosamine 1-carboxy